MVRKAADSVGDVFATAVKKYPDLMLACRDLGHHWRPVTAKREKDGIARVMECTTCGAERYQTLDRQGYIVSSSYRYQAGYTIPGIGRLTAEHRATMRLASIDRSPKD